MSGLVTGLVLRNSEMKGAARLVLVVIADAADDDGSNAWPSIETIASRAGITRRAAQAGVRTCEAAGEVTVEEHKGGPSDRPERYRTHRYTVTIRPWLVAEGDRARGEQRTPLAQSGAQSDADQGRNLTRIRGEQRTPNPPIDPPIDPPLTRTDHETDPLYGFDHFWQAYPKRDGKRLGRAKSEGLWAKLTLEERRAAHRGARHYAAACEVDLTRAKDPERFLAHRCWEDWQTPATPDAARGRSDPLTGRHATPLTELYRQAGGADA